MIHDMKELRWGRNVIHSERINGGDHFKLGLVLTPLPSVGDTLQFDHGELLCETVEPWGNPHDGVTVQGKYTPTAGEKS